jgi:hypothetical protein
MRTASLLAAAPLVAIALAVATACAGDPASPPDPPTDRPDPPGVLPHTGMLQVNLTLFGSGPPPARVLLALDAGQPEPYDGVGPFTLGPLPEGQHTVRLDIPEARCSPSVWSASGMVRGGAATPLELAAECDSIVPGPLAVRTTGDSLSPAVGAEVMLDGRSYGRIGVPGTQNLPRVSSGDHRLTLTLDPTIACAFRPDTAAFRLGRGPDTLVFALECPAPETGTIQVDLTMRVLGIGTPSTSLTVYLDGVPMQAAVGSTTTVTAPFGSHQVRLAVPPGCGLGFLEIPKSPNPQVITLTPAAPIGRAWFNVVCIWP